MRRNFKEKQQALSEARQNLTNSRLSVKVAEATLEKLSRNGAETSVRNKAVEDLKKAIAARDAAEAAVPKARDDWLSSQAAFNASKLGKQLRAEKMASLAGYSKFMTRRGREQNQYMKGHQSQGATASQGGRRSKRRNRNRSRSRPRRTVKRNRTKSRR